MGRSKGGQLYDKYRAEVISIDHPEKQHKAKIRILVLWDSIPDNDLPWAEYLLPLGARENEGEAMPCKVGDHVWVEFPTNGDSRVPLITGSCYRFHDGKGQLPDELMGPLYKHKRSEGEPMPSEAVYGDKVMDLFQILEQVTTNGEWCLTHKPSGTALNITKDGHLVIHCEKDSYRSSVGNTTEQIGGALKVSVVGTATFDCDSDISVKAKGNASINSDADVSVIAKGNALVKGNKATMESSGDMLFKAGGNLMFEGKKIGGKTGSIYDFK